MRSYIDRSKLFVGYFLFDQIINAITLINLLFWILVLH